MRCCPSRVPAHDAASVVSVRLVYETDAQYKLSTASHKREPEEQ